MTTQTTNKCFPDLPQALTYAESLLKVFPLQLSRIAEDLIKKPKNRMLQLLGVTKKADTHCKKMEPNGQWTVELENPGTHYEKAGIWGPRDVQTRLHRLSVWYNRFLPYAYAMMKAEEGFECPGVDYQSINSYYSTCLGFVGLGQGNDDRIVEEDTTLFQEIYNASMNVKSPDLPFYEAFNPCTVYVALKKPKLIPRQFPKDHWMHDHIRKVKEELKR